MKVEGTRSFAAPRQVVWDVLNSPEKMAELMPGVQSFEIADDRHWSAKVKIPLGLGGLAMSIDFEKVEERPIEYASLNAKGNGVGAILSMQTRFELAEDSGATTMSWAADVSIAGPVGSMGQRVLQPIVNQQVGNVLNALEKQVTAAAASPAAGAEAGISPGSPEAYSEAPEGPTQSTQD
ncbi:MAG TPA: SRPBCC domain-containing protein [Gaiellaceae bacterium]|nr:SRPBCC domain-containing protein [Gaiellaceae bacterium]